MEFLLFVIFVHMFHTHTPLSHSVNRLSFVIYCVIAVCACRCWHSRGDNIARLEMKTTFEIIIILCICVCARLFFGGFYRSRVTCCTGSALIEQKIALRWIKPHFFCCNNAFCSNKTGKFLFAVCLCFSFAVACKCQLKRARTPRWRRLKRLFAIHRNQAKCE